MHYGLIIFIFNLISLSSQNKINPDAVNPDWKNDVPQIIHPNKELIDLYNKTWEITAGRVRKGPEGLPASPYLDENCYDDQIWIWDGCFMAMYAKYAPNSFPWKETLLNYYIPIHDKPDVRTPLRIHLRDNPPLFSWVEYDCYQFTGDKKHANHIFIDKQYLQRHFDYFDTIPKGNINEKISPKYNPIHRGVIRNSDKEIIGYTWTGGASGMDNTPRGREFGGYEKIMWIDAICQQALSALYISRMYEQFNKKEEVEKWLKIYNRLKKVINEKYWNEEDGFYYDVELSTGKHSKIKTMASYWALMAEVASPEKASRMVEILKNEQYFGVKYPFPSLSKDDKDFNADTGDYWRGGIWLPMAYMGVKSLEKYGYYELADEMATNIVLQQLRTYHNPRLKQKTIWEVYNPYKDEPSTEHGRRARPEFCGWSALGPISLFIENILGFREVNALKRQIIWDIKQDNATHGIKGLYFGNIKTNLLYNHITKKITITTNNSFTLIINKHKFKVEKGENKFSLQL